MDLWLEWLPVAPVPGVRRDVSVVNEDGLREVRKRVSMVFQGAALFDSLTVGENIAYPLKENMRELGDDERSAMR